MNRIGMVSTKVLNDQVQWVMFGLPGVAYRIQASVNLAAWETAAPPLKPTRTRFKPKDSCTPSGP